MPKRLLPPLNTQTSKEDEIKIVRQLEQDVYGSQSYLASLFTAPLTQWVEGQISSDLTPDVMSEFNHAVETCNRLLDERGRLEREFKLTLERYERSATERERRLSEQLEIARTKNSQGLEELGRTVRRYNELAEQNSKMLGDLSTLDILVRELSTEIVSLKARLYDLEHPK